LFGLLVDRAVTGKATTHDQAAAAVRLVMASECARLEAQARSLAVIAAARPESSAFRAPSGVLAICGQPAGNAHYTGLAARRPVGSGWASAVRPVDAVFLARLSTAAGVPVTLGGAAAPGLGPLPLALGEPPPRIPGDGWSVALAAAVTAVMTATALGNWLAR